MLLCFSEQFLKAIMPVTTSKFFNPVIDVVFGSFKMKEEVLDEQRMGIRWFSLANYDLATTVEVIKEAVRDQRQAKNIVIQVLEKFLGDHDVQVIIDHMYDIYDLVRKQKQNKLAFGTGMFIPSKEKHWAMFGIYNKECQILTERLNVPRVNLHRSVMSQISATDLTLRVRPACWEEFQLGLGIGSTLSHEGMEHLLRYIKTVFDTVFSQNSYVMRSRAAKVRVPPSLASTPGYFDNLFYTQILEDRNIIRPRHRSTGGDRRNRMRCTDRRLPGWRHWAVFRQHGALWNFHCREGILEAHLMLYSKSDDKPVWGEAVDVVPETKLDEKDQTDDEDDAVFAVPNPPMPVRTFSNKAQKKTQNTNCIEIEYAEDKTTELLQVAKDKVQDSERSLTIAGEKMKAYKKDLIVKDAQLAREKASVKHWRAEADKKQALYDDALGELYKLQIKYDRVESENKRIMQEYEFLRSSFEQDHAGKQVTMKFVTNGDIEKYAKQV